MPPGKLSQAKLNNREVVRSVRARQAIYSASLAVLAGAAVT